MDVETMESGSGEEIVANNRGKKVLQQRVHLTPTRVFRRTEREARSQSQELKDATFELPYHAFRRKCDWVL